MLKSIEGYEGYYSASDEGFIVNDKTGRVLKPDNCRAARFKNPYLRVTLSRDNIQKRFALHRIIASTFIPNTDNKEEVNHLDGDRWNNSKVNLEWATKKENLKHQQETGLVLKGTEHGNATYTEEQVHRIRELTEKGFSRKECAEMAGTTLSFVKDVRYGRAWKHI